MHPDGELAIRPLRPTERDDLLALYRHLHRTDKPLPDEAAVQAVWLEMIGDPRTRVIGGYVQGSLVASCTLTVVPNLTRGCQPYGVIENVVTHTEYRNRGHGQAILSHALSQAWSAGCYKVMLMTGRKDEATMRFYRSGGFDPDEKQAFIAKPPA